MAWGTSTFQIRQLRDPEDQPCGCDQHHHGDWKGVNVTLTSESYNGQISEGGTLNGVGFNGSYSGSNPAPSVFYLNGTLRH